MSAVAVTNQTVAEAVQPYIDGVAAGDAAKLEQGFHESARMDGRWVRAAAENVGQEPFPSTRADGWAMSDAATPSAGIPEDWLIRVTTSGLAARRRARRRASRASALPLCREVGSGRFVEASLIQRRSRRR